MQYPVVIIFQKCENQAKNYLFFLPKRFNFPFVRSQLVQTNLLHRLVTNLKSATIRFLLEKMMFLYLEFFNPSSRYHAYKHKQTLEQETSILLLGVLQYSVVKPFSFYYATIMKNFSRPFIQARLTKREVLSIFRIQVQFLNTFRWKKCFILCGLLFSIKIYLLYMCSST